MFFFPFNANLWQSFWSCPCCTCISPSLLHKISFFFSCKCPQLMDFFSLTERFSLDPSVNSLLPSTLNLEAVLPDQCDLGNTWETYPDSTLLGQPVVLFLRALDSACSGPLLGSPAGASGRPIPALGVYRHTHSMAYPPPPSPSTLALIDSSGC